MFYVKLWGSMESPLTDFTMKKLLLIVFLIISSPSYAGYLMPVPDGFCVAEHYCTYESDVHLSAPVLPDNPDYRFYYFTYVYPSLIYPRTFDESVITYPEADSICVRYVHVLFPCTQLRVVNQQSVPEYLVHKITPSDPQWNWIQIDCYADPLQRQQLADAITAKINYYNSFYNGIEDYPAVYPGRNKLFFITLSMTRGGVTVEPVENNCPINVYPYRLFAFVYPSIKYTIAYTGIGNVLRRGGSEVGKGAYNRGLFSSEKGVGGYEVRY